MAKAKTHDAPTKQARYCKTKYDATSISDRGKALLSGLQFASLLPRRQTIRARCKVSGYIAESMETENENYKYTQQHMVHSLHTSGELKSDG